MTPAMLADLNREDDEPIPAPIDNYCTSATKVTVKESEVFLNLKQMLTYHRRGVKGMSQARLKKISSGG